MSMSSSRVPWEPAEVAYLLKLHAGTRTESGKRGVALRNAFNRRYPQRQRSKNAIKAKIRSCNKRTRLPFSPASIFPAPSLLWPKSEFLFQDEKRGIYIPLPPPAPSSYESPPDPESAQGHWRLIQEALESMLRCTDKLPTHMGKFPNPNPKGHGPSPTRQTHKTDLRHA